VSELHRAGGARFLDGVDVDPVGLQRHWRELGAGLAETRN
jgi:hypothetical protein